jgi:glucose-6-phosphate isomerase
MERLRKTEAWLTLDNLAPLVKRYHMRDMFNTDPKRAEKYTLALKGLTLDYSKNRVTQEVLDALFALAEQRGVKQKIADMFAGQHINTTENRAVLHTALRNFSDKPVYVDGENVMPDVHNTLKSVQVFTEKVHNGEHTGYTGKSITTVVSIGIGGSFLGPKIVTETLKPYWKDGIKVHFVDIIDGCHIHDVLAQVDV